LSFRLDVAYKNLSQRVRRERNGISCEAKIEKRFSAITDERAADRPKQMISFERNGVRAERTGPLEDPGIAGDERPWRAKCVFSRKRRGA